MSCEVRARLQFNNVQVETGEGGWFGIVQFNDVPVAGWGKERVGASDEEKKFLMGIVMADRNNNTEAQVKDGVITSRPSVDLLVLGGILS
jgi:hypothetical protein